MNKVHISQFYACSRISYACELYYVCELGKYLFFNYGETLSIDGVLLESDLNKSIIWDYFRMAVDEGWVVDTGITDEEFKVSIQYPLDMKMNKIRNILLTTESVVFDREDNNKRRNDINYAYRTPERYQVSFSEMKDEYWYWTLNGEGNRHFLENNKIFGHNQADQSWLSLIAFVAVERLKKKAPTLLLIEFTYQIVYNFTPLSYILILAEKTNCFSGWVKYTFDNSVEEEVKDQINYAAWWKIGQDKGYLNRWYSPAEKREYLKSFDIKEGDFVMLYKRKKAQKTNYIKEIDNCHLARLISISGFKYTFEVFNTTKTYFQGFEEFEDYTIAVKHMYQDKKPYEELNISTKSIDINDLGIMYMMQTEENFIVPLSESEDYIRMRVSNGESNDTLLLPQNDLVYWICRDYGYEFDEERFLSKYFKDREPLYTQYMRGDVLEAKYYINE